jgi:3D (Asp-Asp-Asp) domain-containing protein
MSEAGYTLYSDDQVDPPSETPITGAMTVNYRAAGEFVITIDGTQVKGRSAANTVGQALEEAGVPLIGLDYSKPDEESPLPRDGKIQVVRVSEKVALTEKAIPFDTRTELSADLEIDQQALLQGGEPGLVVARLRTRSEDGIQVSQQSESESTIRPPQDRIMGIGTKIVMRTATVDGVTFEYYRAVHMYTTSYSPCRSATLNGSCSYGTSSGMPVQRGTVAMVYAWYLAFGGDKLYIPGYGFATVGDVGGSFPPYYHYWVDLGWTDAEYQPMEGWTTVYFLAPVPQNIVYVLP